MLLRSRIAIVAAIAVMAGVCASKSDAAEFAITKSVPTSLFDGKPAEPVQLAAADPSSDVYLTATHEKAEKEAEAKQAQAIRRTDVFRTQKGRRVQEHRQTVEVFDADGNNEVCAGGNCAGNCSAGNCSAGACSACQNSNVRTEKTFIPEDDGSGQYSGGCSSGNCGGNGRMRRGLFGRVRSRGGCSSGGCN